MLCANMDEKEFSCVVVNKLSFFSFDFLLLNAEKMKAVVRENLSVYFFFKFFCPCVVYSEFVYFYRDTCAVMLHKSLHQFL